MVPARHGRHRGRASCTWRPARRAWGCACGVWDLSTHNGIEVCSGARPFVWVRDQQHVRMRQAAQEFDQVHVAYHTPKDVALRQVSQQLI